MKYSFRTHNGEILLPDDSRLVEACEKVAKWHEQNAIAVRKENHYGSHVTENQKDQFLAERLEWAEKIRQRLNLNNFSVWQRVNAELTGECIAFLSK